MKLKFDSTLLLNNLNVFQQYIDSFYKNKFILTKKGLDKFKYKENEFCIIVLKDVVFSRDYIDYFMNKRYEVNNEVKLKPQAKEKKEKGNIYITNSCIYFDHEKFNIIKFNNIKEIEVLNKSLIIHDDKKFRKIIYTNSIQTNIYILLIIEILNRFKLDKDMLNKSITLSATKNKSNAIENINK